jgi:hypothetical protein
MRGCFTLTEEVPSQSKVELMACHVRVFEKGVNLRMILEK